MSASATARNRTPFSEEARRNMSVSARNRTSRWSEKTKRNMSAAATGKKRSKESKKNSWNWSVSTISIFTRSTLKLTRAGQHVTFWCVCEEWNHLGFSLGSLISILSRKSDHESIVFLIFPILNCWSYWSYIISQELLLNFFQGQSDSVSESFQNLQNLYRIYGLLMLGMLV